MKEVLLGEKQIGDIIKFFESPDSITRQIEAVVQLKKRKAAGMLGGGIAIIVIFSLAFIYGIADVFGKMRLPMGVLFLIGGPIGIVSGIAMVFSGLSRVQKASKVKFEEDLERVCEAFYSNAFCKRSTDSVSKENQIVDVCDCIPKIVLDNYKESGWETFLGKQKARRGGQEIECSSCHKQAKDSEARYTPVPVTTKYREEFRNQEPAMTQELINNLYLKCKYCGTVFCYECIGYSSSKEIRFLCPACGKGTNGWDGLASRWSNLRNEKVSQDIDFTLFAVDVKQSSRSNPHVLDMTILLNGAPFGNLVLYNVALNIENKWFLASPEPLLRGKSNNP